MTETPDAVSLSPATQVLLVCPKCTRYAVFAGSTQLEAQLEAKKKGWRMQNDKAVCPKCPAAGIGNYARRPTP